MVTVKSKVVATLKIRKNKTTKINKEYSGSCGDVGARRRPVTGAAALSQRDYSCLFGHLHV